jgi:hypothetical protein
MQVLTFVVQKILGLAAGEDCLPFLQLFYALHFDCWLCIDLYLYSYNTNTRVIQLHTNISLLLILVT